MVKCEWEYLRSSLVSVEALRDKSRTAAAAKPGSILDRSSFAAPPVRRMMKRWSPLREVSAVAEWRAATTTSHPATPKSFPLQHDNKKDCSSEMAVKQSLITRDKFTVFKCVGPLPGAAAAKH